MASVIEKKPPRVEHMLRPEIPLRPLVPRVELDSQEVPDFAEHTVFDHANQFPVGVSNTEVRTQQNGAFHLEASTRQRNVFQIGHSSTGLAARILPTDID
jgi:hypothetical protein